MARKYTMYFPVTPRIGGCLAVFLRRIGIFDCRAQSLIRTNQLPVNRTLNNQALWKFEERWPMNWRATGMTQPPQKPQHFSELPRIVGSEKDLYLPLRRCVEDSSMMLVPGFRVVDASQLLEKGSRVVIQHKPDVSTFPEHVDISGEVTRMEEQELPWVIKPTEYWDICQDPPATAGYPSQTVTETTSRGQEEVQEGSGIEEDPHLEEVDATPPNTKNMDGEENEEDEDQGMEEDEGGEEEQGTEENQEDGKNQHMEDDEEGDENQYVGEDDILLESPNTDEARLEWPFEKRTKKATDCRRQIVSYATELNSHQHRLHSFSILICHPYVRFLRFDRAGIIVSSRFNIFYDGQYLIDFLWRFARTTSETRGKDTTVRLANGSESELAKAHLKGYIPIVERPVFVFTIPHEGKDREFLAWGSFCDADSLIGRATRAYPVLDVQTGKVCFLKDSWRADYLQPEADTLRTLNAKKVPHIPTWLCGGDIERHLTRTPEFANNCDSVGNSSWALGKNDVIQRFHHRFVEDCVGTPLHEFTCTRDLLKAIYHAAKAHKVAYEDCQILHRDISANNVLLVWNPSAQEWNGVLVDWDLAKDIKNSDPRNHQRTGTWEFISSRLCQDGTRLHTLQDDLESLVLVLLYHAIRYTRHNMLNRSAAMINDVFSHYVRLSDQSVAGGNHKRLMFLDGGMLFQGGVHFEVDENPPFNQWINIAQDVVAEWIRCKRIEEDETRRNMPLNNAASLKRLLKCQQPTQNLDVEQAFLKDHDGFIDLCEVILDSEGWPSKDAAFDNCRPKERSKEGKAAPLASTEEISSGSLGPSRGKRFREPTGVSALEHQPKKHRSRGN